MSGKNPGVPGAQGWHRLLTLPRAVGVAGFACSVMLGGLTQHGMNRAEDTRITGRVEATVEQMQTRIRSLEARLNATAAFVRTTGPGINPAFADFVTDTLLSVESVQRIQVVQDGSLLAEVGRTPSSLPVPAPAAVLNAVSDRLYRLGFSVAVAPAGRTIALVTGIQDGPDPDGKQTLIAHADVVGLFDSRLPGEGMPPWQQVDIAHADAAPLRVLSLEQGDGVQGRIISRPLAIADELWRLDFQVSSPGLLGTWHWESLAVLCFGLALTMLGMSLVQAVQRRSRDRMDLTATLEVANAELRRRIAERDRMAAVLKESERRYRDIYENALEGIFTTTPEGRFLSANPAMVRMLGFEDELELITRISNSANQLYVDPQRRQEFVDRATEKGAVTDFEAEVRRRDGATIWVSLTARAVRDARGRVIAFQGTAQDVTDRHRAEEALRQAKEQADMANRAKSEFLANMTHELRTPLNAIIGFSEIIGNQGLGPISNPAYAEYAQDIHESGRMLLDLINDILDLSKIESGRKELNERTVDIPRVVRTSLRLVRERALKGGVTLQTDLAEPLPPVRADEVALKQILSNLLSNAVKFTPTGGIVTAGALVAEDGRLLLFVRDTGIGMRAEDIPKAMEPFRQIEGSLSRNAGGVGLGLPLVRALVDLHGGELVLESAPGEGTVARVLLPAERLRLAAVLPPSWTSGV